MDAKKQLAFLACLVCRMIQQWRQGPFNIIEERIRPTLQKIGEEVLLETLIEEVKMSMEASANFDNNEFINWKISLDADSGIVIAKDKYPTIRVSFDMAWQQRNFGNRYASPSGHGLLVGDKTRKPLAFILKSKYCNYCKTWTKGQEANNNNNNEEV
jgi:hypothetical protein